MTDISIKFYHKKELVAYRQWPAVPRVGESVQLHDGLFVVENVLWHSPRGVHATGVGVAAEVIVVPSPVTGERIWS